MFLGWVVKPSHKGPNGQPREAEPILVLFRCGKRLATALWWVHGWGVDLNTALLGSGDGYLIQIGDPHGPGGGALPPPPGYTLLAIVPEPAALALLSLGVLAVLRRRG